MLHKITKKLTTVTMCTPSKLLVGYGDNCNSADLQVAIRTSMENIQMKIFRGFRSCQSEIICRNIEVEAKELR